MKKTMTYKILEAHLIKGEIKQGNEIGIRIDQTLTQDSTGTMAYLQLNAMNVGDVATDLSLAYIDHNMLQSSFENADDHEFIKTSALSHNVVYSKPGNGICHRLHLENFAKPGATMIGSDSHTPTAGGIGMLAMGAGGLDVAVGMAKGIYYLRVPKVINIELINKLNDWVSAKDIILYVLRELSVTGGVGSVIEYTGSGLKTLSVEERATITNMGAELGATTSIFESDEITKDFLLRQGHLEDYCALKADEDAVYDKKLVVDLASLNPLVAFPHSPDNVKEIPTEKIKVDQVAIGSCTNSSYEDFMRLAQILDGKKVHPDVSLVISAGSSNILSMLASNGALAKIIASGARILESSCGPCIGMGQAPKTNGVSLRTFNRNFKGRSGTMDSDVYLVSVECAAASALSGYLCDPTTLDIEYNKIDLPTKFERNENFFVYPSEDIEERRATKIISGPNIKPIPMGEKLENRITRDVVLKAGSNITTDDICPSNAKLLPYRSNIPMLANYCFTTIIPDLVERTKEHNGGIIIAKDNYGQGSSREHAAMLPLYLGIKAVIAVSFARIHKANLINNAILPLVFVDSSDYDKIDEYDEIELINLFDLENIRAINKTKNQEYKLKLEVSNREYEILKYGGYLKYAMSEAF
ncbi:MAG: aconitate hydratase [Erysipelotrichales bacterium]